MERPKEMALLYSDSFSSHERGRSVDKGTDRRDGIEEVDFFSESHRKAKEGSARAGVSDVSPQEDASINTALHLLTTSTRVGQGVEEEKKPNSKLVGLQGELNRLGEENRKLRIMLDQLTRSYGVLHNEYILATQQRAQDFRHGQVFFLLFLISLVSSTFSGGKSYMLHRREIDTIKLKPKRA